MLTIQVGKWSLETDFVFGDPDTCKPPAEGALSAAAAWSLGYMVLNSNGCNEVEILKEDSKEVGALLRLKPTGTATHFSNRGTGDRKWLVLMHPTLVGRFSGYNGLQSHYATLVTPPMFAALRSAWDRGIGVLPQLCIFDLERRIFAFPFNNCSPPCFGGFDNHASMQWLAKAAKVNPDQFPNYPSRVAGIVQNALKDSRNPEARPIWNQLTADCKQWISSVAANHEHADGQRGALTLPERCQQEWIPPILKMAACPKEVDAWDAFQVGVSNSPRIVNGNFTTGLPFFMRYVRDVLASPKGAPVPGLGKVRWNRGEFVTRTRTEMKWTVSSMNGTLLFRTPTGLPHPDRARLNAGRVFANEVVMLGEGDDVEERLLECRVENAAFNISFAFVRKHPEGIYTTGGVFTHPAFDGRFSVIQGGITDFVRHAINFSVARVKEQVADVNVHGVYFHFNRLQPAAFLVSRNDLKKPRCIWCKGEIDKHVRTADFTFRTQGTSHSVQAWECGWIGGLVPLQGIRPDRTHEYKSDRTAYLLPMAPLHTLMSWHKGLLEDSTDPFVVSTVELAKIPTAQALPSLLQTAKEEILAAAKACGFTVDTNPEIFTRVADLDQYQVGWLARNYFLDDEVAAEERIPEEFRPVDRTRPNDLDVICGLHGVDSPQTVRYLSDRAVALYRTRRHAGGVVVFLIMQLDPHLSIFYHNPDQRRQNRTLMMKLINATIDQMQPFVDAARHKFRDLETFNQFIAAALDEEEGWAMELMAGIEGDEEEEEEEA